MGNLAGLLWRGFHRDKRRAVNGSSARLTGLPAEFEARFRHGVIANLRARMPAGVSAAWAAASLGIRPACFTSSLFGRPRCSFDCDVAYSIAQPNQPIIAAPMPEGKVVIARRDIGRQRPLRCRTALHGSAPSSSMRIALNHTHRYVADASIITCTSYSRAILVNSPSVCARRTALRRWRPEWSRDAGRRPATKEGKTS